MMKSVVTFLTLVLSPFLVHAQGNETTPPEVIQSTPLVVAPSPVVVPSAQATPTTSVAPLVSEVVKPAVGTTYVIRQIIKSHHLVVIEMLGDQVTWPVEKIFLVNFEDGKQCTLMVKETSTSYITLDSSHCEFESSISTKNSVEPALVGVIASTPPIENREQDVARPLEQKPEPWARLGMNLYYSTADEVEFNNAYVSTTSGSGNISAKFKTDGALGVGLSLVRMRSHSFGFSLGAAIEMGREIKSITLTGPGGTATVVGSGNLPKLNIFYIEYQGIYRWGRVYLPFGFNISSPWVTDYVGSNIEVKSGFGAVLGVGFLLNDNTSIELLARSIGLYLKETDGSDYVDYRYGTLAGTTLGFKFLF